MDVEKPRRFEKNQFTGTIDFCNKTDNIKQRIIRNIRFLLYSCLPTVQNSTRPRACREAAKLEVSNS